MWSFKGTEFTSDLIEDNLGFVYVITNIINGRQYIGKKLFLSSKTKQVKGKKKKFKVESNWKDYWSSGKEILDDIETLGKDKFTREIIYLCKTKGELSYMEIFEQMRCHAVLSDKYYNGIVNVRINKMHLKNKEDMIKRIDSINSL